MCCVAYSAYFKGIVGDCWFLAALAGIAECDGAVFNLFQDKKVNPEDMHTINIFNSQSMQLESVSIHDYVPILAMANP